MRQKQQEPSPFNLRRPTTGTSKPTGCRVYLQQCVIRNRNSSEHTRGRLCFLSGHRKEWQSPSPAQGRSVGRQQPDAGPSTHSARRVSQAGITPALPCRVLTRWAELWSLSSWERPSLLMGTHPPNPLPKGQTENTLHNKVKSRTAGCEIHNVWYPVKKQTNITQHQEKSDQ